MFDTNVFFSVPINLLFIFSNFAVNQLAYKRLQALCNELDIDDTLVSTVEEQPSIEDLILCGLCMVLITFSCWGSQVFSFKLNGTVPKPKKHFEILCRTAEVFLDYQNM